MAAPLLATMSSIRIAASQAASCLGGTEFRHGPCMWAMKAGIVDSELSMTYARTRDAVVAETIKRWVSCSATRGMWTTAAPLDPTIYPADAALIWPPGDGNNWLALTWRGNIIADRGVGRPLHVDRVQLGQAHPGRQQADHGARQDHQEGQ